MAPLQANDQNSNFQGFNHGLTSFPLQWHSNTQLWRFTKRLNWPVSPALQCHHPQQGHLLPSTWRLLSEWIHQWFFKRGLFRVFWNQSFGSVCIAWLSFGVWEKNLKVLEVGWDHHESFSGASHWHNKGNVAISEHEKHCHTLSSSHWNVPASCHALIAPIIPFFPLERLNNLMTLNHLCSRKSCFETDR